MMELGNDVINDIYEANYTEPQDVSDNESQVLQVRRASSDCDSSIREAWIKAKYIEKAFVIPNVNCVADQKKSNVLQYIVFRDDGWLVRHIRRKRIKLRVEKAEKYSTTTDDTSSSELSIDSNQAVEEYTDDSSDDDDDWLQKPVEETLENFNSDTLLYRSTMVHNLPVMCYALASGASKSWSNLTDSKRAPLHQAILSVGTFLHSHTFFPANSYFSMKIRNIFGFERPFTFNRYLLTKTFDFLIAEFSHRM